MRWSRTESHTCTDNRCPFYSHRYIFKSLFFSSLLSPLFSSIVHCEYTPTPTYLVPVKRCLLFLEEPGDSWLYRMISTLHPDPWIHCYFFFFFFFYPRRSKLSFFGSSCLDLKWGWVYNGATHQYLFSVVEIPIVKTFCSLNLYRWQFELWVYCFLPLPTRTSDDIQSLKRPEHGG